MPLSFPPNVSNLFLLVRLGGSRSAAAQVSLGSAHVRSWCVGSEPCGWVRGYRPYMGVGRTHDSAGGTHFTQVAGGGNSDCPAIAMSALVTVNSHRLDQAWPTFTGRPYCSDCHEFVVVI